MSINDNFQDLIESELNRIEKMKRHSEVKDFSKLDQVIIGIIPGDGIGPIIVEEGRRVLEKLLKEELEKKSIIFRDIDGLTLEERVEAMESVPGDVLAEIKSCDVVLKGPTTTPSAGSGLPNLPSANATLRKELDLFANVRPVKIEDKGIDWMFFRENIEGAYILGSKGIKISEDLSIDFVVETSLGSERIAKMAFEYARRNKKKNVTTVTKSNIVKLTDGNFINTVRKVGEAYPDISICEKLIDATAAKMDDQEFMKGLEVFVMPNLYGDIITDIGAEMQGGLGTVGSANIGNQYAIFEPIHGTAPFLMSNNRGQYANPCSLFRAIVLMLDHIGLNEKAVLLTKALNNVDMEVNITSDKDGATAKEYTDCLLAYL